MAISSSCLRRTSGFSASSTNELAICAAITNSPFDRFAHPIGLKESLFISIVLGSFCRWEMFGCCVKLYQADHKLPYGIGCACPGRGLRPYSEGKLGKSVWRYGRKKLQHNLRRRRRIDSICCAAFNRWVYLIQSLIYPGTLRQRPRPDCSLASMPMIDNSKSSPRWRAGPFRSLCSRALLLIG